MGIRWRFRPPKGRTAKAEPDKESSHPNDTPSQVAEPSPTPPKRKSVAVKEIEKYEKQVGINTRGDRCCRTAGASCGSMFHIIKAVAKVNEIAPRQLHPFNLRK